MKKMSILLVNYFDQFVQTQVSVGYYKNVSEIIRAKLQLLENEGIAHYFAQEKPT